MKLQYPVLCKEGLAAFQLHLDITAGIVVGSAFPIRSVSHSYLNLSKSLVSLGCPSLNVSHSLPNIPVGDLCCLSAAG